MRVLLFISHHLKNCSAVSVSVILLVFLERFA
jgi:hypothetical protein